jgi:DNA (cytosine-5)-methyltransferase 1
VCWQVERDRFCRDVLARHWPAVPRFDDVRTVGAACLAPVDMVCGGFPCQGISDAGRRLGLDDPRSGLWREFARIVGELRPRYVVVENVAALVHRGLDAVLGDLAARGYDALWLPVRAADVGAPHRRARLFIVAWLADADGAGLAQPGAADPAGERCPAERGGRARRSVAAESRVGRAVVGVPAGLGRAWPAPPGRRVRRGEPPRTARGVPARKARLMALGNAVVPAVAEVVGHLVWALERGEIPR